MQSSGPTLGRVVGQFTAAALMVGFLSAAAWASEPVQKPGGKRSACQDCNAGCNQCGRGHGQNCRACRHHRFYEGQDPWANCGCNGSYSYPVPPLYTYHWRGIARQHSISEYRSPYRYTGLKSFEEANRPEPKPRQLEPILHQPQRSPSRQTSTHSARRPAPAATVNEAEQLQPASATRSQFSQLPRRTLLR